MIRDLPRKGWLAKLFRPFWGFRSYTIGDGSTVTAVVDAPGVCGIMIADAKDPGKPGADATGEPLGKPTLLIFTDGMAAKRFVERLTEAVAHAVQTKEPA